MKDVVTAEIRNAFRLVMQNKLSLLACCVSDILFFVFYGFFTAPIYLKLVQYTNIIGAFASEALKNLAREQKSIFAILFEGPIRPYFFDMLLLLLILGATVFMIYVLLQGFCWKTALAMSGKKIKYLDYLKLFIKVNLVWMLFFAFYYFAGFAIKIRSIAIQAFTETAPSNVLSHVLLACLLVVAYFAVISYSCLGLKKAFATGYGKMRHLLPSFLLAGVFLLLIYFLTNKLIMINFHAGFALGLILLIPAFTVARVYLVKAIQRVC